jgi:hypothetical protein
MLHTVLWPAIKVYDRCIHLAERSSEPYATHVPVLVGVAAACRAESVVEFGSGTFSTMSFLDQKAFPSIRRVDSYENNQEWFDRVRQNLPSRERINLHLVEGEMYKAVRGAQPSTADMIFLDDSPSDRTRVPTVREVARSCGEKPVVVMHDHELWRLRLATRDFEHRISIDALNPQCCVMWNGHQERTVKLQRVRDIIRKFAASIPLTDVRAWADVFSREL